MRTLFTTQPARGHLAVLAPFARELFDRGHEVLFATGRSFCPAVEAEGFPCAPAGADWSSQPIWKVAPGAFALPVPARDAWAMAVFAAETAAAMALDLLSIASEWRPDLVVRDCGELGGCVVAERLGVPHASIEVDTCAARYAFRHLGAVPLGKLLRSLQMPPDADVVLPYRHLHLTLMPRRFYRPGDAVAPTARFVRPPDTPDSSPSWMADLPERPTVFASLGTAVRTPATVAAILEALRNEPVNVVVTLGGQLDPASFGPTRQGVRIERYVHQTAVMRRCAAVVTHAGFGTVKDALRLGLPMVVMPFQHDQHYNARRCAALGAAIEIGPRDRTPERIRSAARAVLEDPSYRERSMDMAAEIAALPADGPRLLEDLVLKRM